MNNSENSRPSSDAIEGRIREIISSVTGKQLADDADGLQNLGLSSLDKLEILTLLESVFDVTLTEEVAQQFSSVSSVARIVLRMRNDRQEHWRLSL
ncbi:MAG: hypothetical protein JXR76_00325 [Deltaproteobacteria bacterium]|nr:hypothetical protein [Deltaproteobacteria bacterium]